MSPTATLFGALKEGLKGLEKSSNPPLLDTSYPSSFNTALILLKK